MGLAVALQLIKDGHVPTVYEADDRVGGMTASFDFSGLRIERFYHFHCTSDVAFFETLAECGLQDRLRWTETKMGYYYQRRLSTWGNPIALLTFPGLSLIAKVRYGLHAFLCVKRDNWRPLDKLEAIAWIRKWVGAEAYEVLWRRLFDYKFYHFSTDISAAWIWSRIRRIGRSRYNIFREKLGYVVGGSELLMNAMKAKIEEGGGEVRLKSPVSKVTMADGHVRGVVVDDVETPFDTVVSTLPLPYVPRLMPDLPTPTLAAYQALKNVAVVCVIVKLRRHLTGYFWLNVNDPDMDIPGLVEYTNLQALDSHVIYVPFYMPADIPKYAEPDDVFADKCRRYLTTINPNLADNDFVDIKVNRYRFSQPVCPPGFLESLPPPKSPIQGLWIADTSHYYPEDRGISESIAFGRDLARQACA